MLSTKRYSCHLSVESAIKGSSRETSSVIFASYDCWFRKKRVRRSLYVHRVYRDDADKQHPVCSSLRQNLSSTMKKYDERGLLIPYTFSPFSFFSRFNATDFTICLDLFVFYTTDYRQKNVQTGLL